MSLGLSEGWREASNNSGRRYGATGGELVSDGVLFGFDSGAVGWLGEERNNLIRAFKMHSGTCVGNGLPLANSGSRETSDKALGPTQGKS